MKRNIFCGLFLAALLLAAHNLEAAPEKAEKKNLRPKVAVIQKNGKKQMRRCFRDEDKNGFCDRGTDQKGKCKNNCRKAEDPAKKAAPAAEENKPQIQNNDSKSNAVSNAQTQCACCPFAGNCANGCLTLLNKNKAVI